LLLDTGDALVGGGILGDSTEGEAIVAGMNLLGYDAMALGPKELALGLDTLRKRAAEAQFPVLSANVVLSGTDELLVPPFAVVEVSGHRVGLVGLTRVPGEPVAGFEVLDPQQAAAHYVPVVAAQAETIVVLTNLAYRPALALAAAVPGIDLVVASLPDQLPRQAVRAPETGTLVVAAEQPVARHTGRRVGRLAVSLGSDGRLSGESWRSVQMDPGIPDDAEMAALLDRYRH
jgi:2',3'-cyclic-nucleotide 2'-phosphodiesterase (5'-nucleotidase family)